MPWGGFVTIVRSLRDHGFDAAAATAALDELAGFGPLLALLKEHFVKRGWILRCYRIADDLMTRIQFTELPRLAVRAEEDALRLRRYLAFVDAAGGDSTTAEELCAFLRGRLASDVAEKQQVAWQELLDRLSLLRHEIEGVDADFRALERLEDEAETFTAEELDELRPLLGLRGLDTEARLRHTTPNPADLAARQQHWGLVLRTARRGSARQAVAERARARYGAILGALEAKTG